MERTVKRVAVDEESEDSDGNQPQDINYVKGDDLIFGNSTQFT
jgi:hypothetical protein